MGMIPFKNVESRNEKVETSHTTNIYDFDMFRHRRIQHHGIREIKEYV